MPTNSHTVFVLGAGFTKAFLPDAPLMTDDYDALALMEKFRHFPAAQRLLKLELAANTNNKINIERLMTRLDSGMPYDKGSGTTSEIALMLRELKESFFQRLQKAKEGTLHGDDLEKFASYCVKHKAHCVTFNYDDVLDTALFTTFKQSDKSRNYWHPDGGYGFFCKEARFLVHQLEAFMDQTAMYVLKLHGSINWRVRLGAIQPYSVDDIVHRESWLPHPPRQVIKPEDEVILQHLERNSFIVPPVLQKSALNQQPVLGLIWSLAHKALQQADRVFFIGYSFPTTDLAAYYLFQETLNRPNTPQIRVVNYAPEEQMKAQTVDAYRKVFPHLDNNAFDFQGALDWSKEFLQQETQAETFPT